MLFDIMADTRFIQPCSKSTSSESSGYRPVFRAVALLYPLAYYGYVNSLAVEMGELGRIEEAFNALRIALSSPFGQIYIEWQETRDDILLKARGASRSQVAFSPRGD